MSFKTLVIFWSLSLVSCCTYATNPNKVVPEYRGVDPRAEPYVSEWLGMAQKRGIRFDEQVTVGFKDIHDGNTVGLTSFGRWFREIDLDNSYWRNSTDTGRKILVRHELDHAYCGRLHDYAKDKEYIKGKTEDAGFLYDGCPASIMFPVIITDRCFNIHREHYDEEMFERCEPL